MAVMPVGGSKARMKSSSPSGSTSLALTSTVAVLPTARRTASGLAVGAEFGSSSPDTSTMTSVLALVPPCGSAAW